MDILFINNGTFYCGLLTEFLCLNGYTVYEASTADKVREIIQKKRIHVVLCYVPLDVSETLTLLAGIRQHDAALPIITLMTHSQSKQEHQVRSLSPFCLIMPFRTEALLNIIYDATGIRKKTVSFRSSGEALIPGTVAGVK